MFFVTLVIVFSNQGCDVMQPEEMIQPGRLKINLIYTSRSSDIQATDSLFVQARDFKIFKDSTYANVYQNPNQFLPFEDSIVSFNVFEGVFKDSTIQVAYGSIASLTYDSLLFQLAPGQWLRRDNNFYPITTNYSTLGSDVNFTNIVKISDKIKIRENKTTTLTIKFVLEDNVFRYLDQFVFIADVDTFFISNE
jgi:hypothetical protein